MTVNGHSVTRHELQPGDVIRVGDTELRWGLAANPAVTTISPMRHVSEARSETSAPTLAPDALLGQSVEHYRIQQLESRTRTGVVFRATDRDSGAMIAFKVFWPELMDNAAVRDRFLQAIRTMQPLRHENLVVLFDAGVTDGLCWIASEFVIGESAKQMIQRAGVSGMLDWKPVLRIATDIAKGLEFAASQGVVHRNITPTNILIRKADGVAKLGDLMLAKALDSLGVAKVTRAADIIGDLPYLSPEQTVGERLDARSDLYSLGATIYALLTGRPPCEGLTTAETVLKIQTQRPEPPTKFHLSIPALFEGVVMRLLAKRPDDRFADATQLLRELDRVDRYTQPVVSRNAPPDADLI
jgi:serine/threonine protein kinase